MPKDNRIPDGIINPFSDVFLDTWQLWKDFRWQEHKFKYKGCISEQVKLMQLAKLADGHEETAIAIIMQSMGNGWSGLYALKTIKIQPNGQQQAGNAGSTREQLNDLYSKRFGAGR